MSSRSCGLQVGKTILPEDKQTSETALLFLQLIMRKLRRGERGRSAVGVRPLGARSEIAGEAAPTPALPARAAVVVPNGTLLPRHRGPESVPFLGATPWFQ